MIFRLNLADAVINRFFFAFLFFTSLISCKDVGDKSKNKKPTAISIEERAKKQIESDIHFYIESLNEKRFDELIELTSTKMFVNKSLNDYKLDLIKQNVAGVYKEINLKKIESIGKIVEYKNEYYCKIYCEGDVVLNVSGQAVDEISTLKYRFEYSYDMPGEIVNENKIVIEDVYFSFIAHTSKGSNFLWKYIEVDKQKEPLYDKIIPVEVLDKL